MGVDVTAVASVTGITTEFRDLRAGKVLYLPQAIFVLAQGCTDSVYATTKFTGLSAGQVASKMGYGCPAHLTMRELRPMTGDGVGTIPVHIYPLVDAAGAVAAAGAITPVGTQTKSASYRVKMNNIATDPIVVPKDATPSVACRLFRDAITAKLEMPVKATYTYGTVVAGALVGTGNGTLTALSAPGTPKPGVWTLEVTGAVTNGGVWKLIDPDGNTVTTGLTQTVGVGTATVFTTAGLQFTVTDGTTDFAVGAKFTITVPATVVVVTAKWKGLSGNDLYVEVEGEDLGITFGLTQFSGGLANPTVDAALAQMGNVWETMGINALGIGDTTALDTIKVHGDARWGTTVKKPYTCWVGNTIADAEDATVVAQARPTDRVNGQLVCPGSRNLPFVVAARQVARMAVTANNNPPESYQGLRCESLTAGTDGQQWDWPTRDQAIKWGSSTIEVNNGVVEIGDVVTFYRPSDEEPPAYRKLVTIVRLQNILFNLDYEFSKKEWKRAPLIPDDQATTNRKARKPKHALAAVYSIFDNLGLEAILSDVKGAKQATTVAIDSQNPNRINIVMNATALSGNTDIKNLELFWGFYYGVAPLAA